jgi:hypothetical protein
MATAAMNKLDSIRAEDEEIKIRKSFPGSFCGENVHAVCAGKYCSVLTIIIK